MLVCESRGTVDQNLHFDDPSDEVKVTDGCIQRGDQLDGHTSGGLFPLFDGEISSQPALPGLAILPGDVAGHKHQAPTRVNGTNAATGFVKAGSSIFKLSNVSYTDKPFSSQETAPPKMRSIC